MSDESGVPWRLETFVRIRPLEGVAGSGSSVVKPEHRLLYLTDPTKSNQSHQFVFNQVFDARAAQGDIFEQAGKPLVDHVLQGFNACCFAYGQTGSGKSFTMFGRQQGSRDAWEQRGIVPRCAEQLFTQLSQAASKAPETKPSVFVSFLEVYLEQVRDLAFLAGGPGQTSKRASPTASVDHNNLEIYEDPSGMTLVRDLTYIQVNNVEEVMAVLKSGYELRQTSGADETSRSHTVFTLSVVQPQTAGQPPITGRLHLVDLAGSERLDKGRTDEARLIETKAIHTSLTALGKVLNTLASQRGSSRSTAGAAGAAGAGSSGAAAAAGQQQQQHVPFRDTKLTRVLKDSLQGSCLAVLLASIRPNPDDYEETFNTLQFAVQCQGVRAQATPQLSMPKRGADQLTQQLTEQVEELKQELEFTHAHYQKLIETVAGPRWAADMGPVERPDPPADAGPLTGQASVASLAAEGSRVRMQEGLSMGGGSLESKQALTRSLTSINTLETKVKRAEAQLASQMAKLQQSQSRLTTKRVEAEEFRERMVSKNANQAEEMMRLRQELKEARAALRDCDALSKHRESEARRRFDEECARLRVDNCALVAQLGAMNRSVNVMSETRGPKALAVQQQQEALAQSAEKKLKYQVAVTAEEKDRQIDIAKQQSTYQISRKAEEALALKDQIQELRDATEAEVQALKAEGRLLVDYASKAIEVLRRMEAGVYGPVENTGLKPLQVPTRDKARQEARIRYLSGAMSAIDRLASAAAAAAIAPTSAFPMSLPSTGPASRIQSAGTAHSSLPVSARGRPPSGLPHPVAEDSASYLPGGAIVSAVSAADIEVLRLQWEATRKDAVKAQVVSEMKNDKTVEYIRSLESQIARYQQELQVEQKRGNEMAVALRSAQRLASNYPESPVVKAMGNTGRSTRNSWGLPSPAGTFGPNGKTAVRDAARPGTAGAVLVGGAKAGMGSGGRWGGSSGLQMSGSLGNSGGGGFIQETGY